MNKKKRCRHCKEYFNQDVMIRVPLGYFCSREHATKHGQEKAAGKREKDRKKSLDNLKNKVKTASEWIKEAQAAVNKYIRIRDKGNSCISCGSTSEQKRGGTMEAGHYRSRGSASHLRFNVFNVNLQCSRCNRYLSGNVVEYRKGLIQKYGIKKVEILECDNSQKRFTIEYLKRVKSIFTRKARLYEKRFR